MADPEDLEELMLHRAGERLLIEYQELVDARDIDGLAGIIDPDVELTRHDGTVYGAQAFLDLYRRFAAEDITVAHHMATNIQVSRRDDGSAVVHSKFLALTTHGTGEARQIWGRYTDRIARRDGRWRLLSKRIDVSSMAVLDPQMLAPGGIDTFGAIPR
ncbi:nuclear transport factor 2 family protein [Gordonia caeni]|uniref:SnoaL-like domain-containing protein n=1 Tax=Gordonia caeni TaxID=1007097 RepID=A0ABP7NRI7_9ACTN